MKATIVRTGLFCIVLVSIWLAACTTFPGATQTGAPAASTLPVTLMSDNTAGPIPTIDATATSAAIVIAQALSATPGMTPIQTPDVADSLQAPPPTVDPAAAQTSEAQRIERAVAATLTAQPTTTPTATPTVPPTATPNLGATQTTVAQQIATSVMATLMAQPKATSTPAPTSTPVPTLRIQNFATCLEPCRGDRANAQRIFPAGAKKVYLTWVFSNFPVGAHYTRSWTLVGKGEWTRYECTWPGPEAGTENIALSAPGGLHSGVWEVTITLDQVVVLREQLTIEGNWDLWDPPGLFTTCYGTR